MYPTVYPKKYAHGFCFAVLCCGYTLTDFPISIRLTSLALWQSNDCPSASKATLMNMDKYFMWIHYERLHNHNKAKHNKTVCIFLGIYCIFTNEPSKSHPRLVILAGKTQQCSLSLAGCGNIDYGVLVWEYWLDDFVFSQLLYDSVSNTHHIAQSNFIAWNHSFVRTWVLQMVIYDIYIYMLYIYIYICMCVWVCVLTCNWNYKSNIHDKFLLARVIHNATGDTH